MHNTNLPIHLYQVVTMSDDVIIIKAISFEEAFNKLNRHYGVDPAAVRSIELLSTSFIE